MKSTHARAGTQPERIPVARPTVTPPAADRPTLALADDAISVAAVSPARALQDQLSAMLSAEAGGAKWSKRATLVFILGTCGAFWAAIAWGVAWLLQR